MLKAKDQLSKAMNEPEETVTISAADLKQM